MNLSFLSDGSASGDDARSRESVSVRCCLCWLISGVSHSSLSCERKRSPAAFCVRYGRGVEVKKGVSVLRARNRKPQIARERQRQRDREVLSSRSSSSFGRTPDAGAPSPVQLGVHAAVASARGSRLVEVLSVILVGLPRPLRARHGARSRPLRASRLNATSTTAPELSNGCKMNSRVFRSEMLMEK